MRISDWSSDVCSSDLGGLPPLLVCSHRLPDPSLIKLLAEQSGIKARMLTRPQGVRRTWLEQAQQNAEMALSRILRSEELRLGNECFITFRSRCLLFHL